MAQGISAFRTAGIAALAVALALPAAAERPRPRPVPPQAVTEVSAPRAGPQAAPQALAPQALAPQALAPQALAPQPMAPVRGAVTELPLPRFVSLKTGEGNARRGPGLTHRIDWTFTRAGMPLRITDEYGHWRRVEDAEGLGGWVHYSLLSGTRSAQVAAEMADFRSRPDPAAPVVFRAERGVMGRLVACREGWCRLNVEGTRGWTEAPALWGVDPDETID